MVGEGDRTADFIPLLENAKFENKVVDGKEVDNKVEMLETYGIKHAPIPPYHAQVDL